MEEGFLKRHCRVMPRIMLRYAIEKFAEEKRRMYLKGECCAGNHRWNCGIDQYIELE